MKIHAIRTGSVRIKRAQVEGRGHGLARRLEIFTDRNWTGWLPTYTWAIDHKEGVIVVDTGQGAHLLKTGTSLHPYIRWEVAFRIDREEEIGPQLRALGIGPRDVKPTPTGRIIVEAARGHMPGFVDTGLNLVHVDDVATGHLHAGQVGEYGSRRRRCA